MFLPRSGISSIRSLSLSDVTFPPEHKAHLLTTLACSKTLEHINNGYGASPLFCDHYYVALSNHVETKLERLQLYRGPERRVDHHGGARFGVGEHIGAEAAIEAEIRNLLKWNVQRQICPSLFVAIGDAETDATRKQCLVEAFEAVDIPVLFECITVN